MVRVKEEKPSGILNTRAVEGLRRYWASDDLAPFVEHYWIVRWNLAEPVTAETLPHPSVHMVLERGRSEIVGVMRGRFSRKLEGTGRVIGTKFRPGAFRAFVDRPVASFTDRRWSLRNVFGVDGEGFDSKALAHDEDTKAIKVIEAFLRSFRPAATSAMELASRITARIAEDRRITKVDQIVEEFAIPPRQVQRLFREYVGVTPKWVIQRYRLIEAAERLAAGAAEDFAGLALDLGYADQAHFIRDFKKLVGRPPAGYARAVQR
ncbi:MAG TPA: helix-turn-helix domain-containing protein [Thermoanaerobaculia bacterium]|nr:helix-turn-helix domain-containing protein [Thermoanaerobaculia bacterium]